MKEYVAVGLWLVVFVLLFHNLATPRSYGIVMMINTQPPKPSCKPASWFDAESDPRLGKPFTPKQFRIFAFADGEKGGVCDLATTLNGYTLNVLGFQKSRLHRTDDPAALSYMKKLLWMRHVVHHHANDNDVFLFLDAFDSVAQHDVSLALPRFTEIMQGKRGVLFQGERNCFPFDEFRSHGGGWAIMHDQNICVDTGTPRVIQGKDMCSLMSNMSTSSGPYRWLNSGGYMGDALSLRAMLAGTALMEQRYKGAGGGDQTFAQLTLVSFPRINMRVDVNAAIWFALQNYENGDVPGIHVHGGCDANYTGAVNTLTGIQSIFMHFNGNGKPFQGSCTKAVALLRRATALGHEPIVFLDHDRRKRVVC